MELLTNAAGYGAGLAVRSYCGIHYLYTVREYLEQGLSYLLRGKLGETLGNLVGKQLSYVLAFPAVNLVGELISLSVSTGIAYLIKVGARQIWGREEEPTPWAPLIVGFCAAFVVKNLVAFHSLEGLYNALKAGTTWATERYLGEKSFAGPISKAVGLQFATFAAFPAASLVGDGAGLAVKQGIHLGYKRLTLTTVE
ncbi:MAG: hypothetical protein AB7F31_01350 [Parachlamydiales bacterium]